MYWTSVMLRLWSEWNPRGQSGMYLRMTSLVEYLMCVVSPTRTLDPDLRGPRGFNALFKLGARGTDMGVMYKKFGRFSQWLGRRIVDHDSYCIALFIEVPCYPSIHSIHVALRNERPSTTHLCLPPGVTKSFTLTRRWRRWDPIGSGLPSETARAWKQAYQIKNTKSSNELARPLHDERVEGTSVKTTMILQL